MNIGLNEKKIMIFSFFHNIYMAKIQQAKFIFKMYFVASKSQDVFDLLHKYNCSFPEKGVHLTEGLYFC